MWGRDCPMMDADQIVNSSDLNDVGSFTAVEYDQGLVQAFVEYKSSAADRDRVLAQAGFFGGRMHPTYSCLIDAANNVRGVLPVLLVFYWKHPWVFEVYPLNAPALMVYDLDPAFDGMSLVLTERRFVASLYFIRNRTAPVDLLERLDNVLPPALAEVV
jgi:hypothetical protein